MKLRDHISFTTTDYGAALLDERRGTYWQLNATGAVILSALLEGESPSAAAARLATEFEVSPAEAEGDVSELTQQLAAASLTEP